MYNHWHILSDKQLVVKHRKQGSCMHIAWDSHTVRTVQLLDYGSYLPQVGPYTSFDHSRHLLCQFNVKAPEEGWEGERDGTTKGIVSFLAQLINHCDRLIRLSL
jgi:hypothetical protein